MRLFALILASLICAALSGCAEAQTPAPSLKPAASTQHAVQAPQSPSVTSGTAPAQLPMPLQCKGIFEQGGVAACRTLPGGKVKIARGTKDFYFETADDQGRIMVGFDRDETQASLQVMESPNYAASKALTFSFTPRDWDISRIDGLPKNMVSEYSAADLKRIRASSAKKKKGFDSRADQLGFADGFTSPVETYRKTTNFGAQRILNGEPKKPHYGVDMAAPVGTPIMAPADGIVSLADDDLYFEGAMVLLDHGQGLISMYLHVNDILVKDGDAVKRGDVIATIGSKGRSTGPHLCWRLKWRNRNLDPELLTKWTERAEIAR